MTRLYLLVILILLTGCDNKELKEREKQSWQACINQGGVPIQSWFNENILGDCKFNNGIRQ